MAVDPGTGSRPSRKRKKSLRRVQGENAADKAVAAQAPTKARYQDVVRGAQQRIAQQYADDPVIGRVAPEPGGTRHRETADSITKQVFGYGLGAAAPSTGPFAIPLAAASAAFLASDPATTSQFRTAKERIGKGSKGEQTRAALDLTLLAGLPSGGVGPGGKSTVDGPKPKKPAPARRSNVGEGFNAWRGDLWDGLKKGKPFTDRKALYRGMGEAEFDAAMESGSFRPLLGQDLYVTADADRIAGGAYGSKGGGYIIEFDPKKVTTHAAKSQTLADVDEIAAESIPASAIKAIYKWDEAAGDHVRINLPPAQRIIEALPEAKRLRGKQEGLYHEERKKRAAKFEEALELGGEEGWRAAMAELKGELPKLKLGDALRDFDQSSARELFEHIRTHEALRPYERVNTRKALQKVLEGTVPTRSEIKLLERTFGAELAAQIAESSSKWRTLGNMGLSVINVPRAMMATLDLSGLFRQALVLGVRHPNMWRSEIGPMLKAFKSEDFHLELMDEIASRPTFKKMQDGKLQLTDFENLTTREEGFQSTLAETLTGGKRSPVRMSGRAYTSLLNKFRADAFDNYLRMADEAGYDTNDVKLLRDIASWVNTATGRGSIKQLEAAMPVLTAVLFSPRLIFSRLQLLNPVYYARLHPFARKQALRGAAQTLGMISLTLYMAKMAGAEVGLDPRSSDFGKIKVGDTRVDIAGGFQQYVVNAYRIIKQETVSSTSGEVTELEGGFAKQSGADVAMDFLQGKMAPVPKFGWDWWDNETFNGEPFDPRVQAPKLVMPINAVSSYEAYKESGPGAAAATAALGGIGFGVLTYGDDDKKSSGGRSLRSGGERRKSLRSGGGGRRKSLRRN